MSIPMHHAKPPESNELDFDSIDAATAKEWLAAMVLIRAFESVLDPLSLAGKIPGGVHLAIGQEAVAVGANRALAQTDIITTPHRPHHHALAKGITPRAALAELFGKATGCSGGRGGTMHLTDFEHGYFPGNAIVGASTGLALGAAFAAMYQHRPQVAAAFMGDGAANTGRTWEALNMAVIWKLPLIAICENNLYAVETYAPRVTGGPSIAARAATFGAAASTIDGQDVVAVHHAVAEARKRALNGDGPTFIEARTYRFEGHSTGEMVAYREDTEVEEWKRAADPISRLANAMNSHGWLEHNALSELEAQAHETVRDAIEFADSSPLPDPSAAVAEINSLDWLPTERVNLS